VAARHATRQATRGTIVNYASIPLIFMGGWAGYAVRQAAGLAVPLGFLKFSRGFESEADRLGLEYMYKTGYDPTAFVDFFEKIESLEKKKPGTIARVFSTHPMNDSRIKAAQKEIQQDLEPRPEYVITTSEFDEVKHRLLAMENRRKPEDYSGRPTLRRSTRSGTVESDGSSGKKDDDERPTLKRRN
jgi:predicted Zn-dependent protease